MRSDFCLLKLLVSVASPAEEWVFRSQRSDIFATTISSCFCGQTDIGWTPYVESWVQARSLESEKVVLEGKHVAVVIDPQLHVSSSRQASGMRAIMHIQGLLKPRHPGAFYIGAFVHYVISRHVKPNYS